MPIRELNNAKKMPNLKSKCYTLLFRKICNGLSTISYVYLVHRTCIALLNMLNIFSVTKMNGTMTFAESKYNRYFPLKCYFTFDQVIRLYL